MPAETGRRATPGTFSPTVLEPRTETAAAPRAGDPDGRKDRDHRRAPAHSGAGGAHEPLGAAALRSAVIIRRVPATPDQLTDEARTFLTERHLASFSSLRRDGTVHVTACGFTWDEETGIARVITSGTSQKAVNATGGVNAAVTQIDGPRWLTLEGVATTNTDPDAIADAVRRYAVRYREPRVNPARVTIELRVTRVLGSAAMLDR